MKKSKIYIIMIALLIVCVASVAVGCNNNTVKPESEPQSKYPMNQLPTDLLEPAGYVSVTDSFADGFKAFIFKFNDINSAGVQKTRLSADLETDGYSVTVDGAVSEFKKDEVIIRLRQSVSEDESALYVSVPYTFIVKNLPEKINDVPLFDGKLYNVPVIKSAESYDAFTNVTLTLSYFECDAAAINAYCRYIELEGFAFGKNNGNLNVKISTVTTEETFSVQYTIDGFDSEGEWERFVKEINSINFEKGALQPVLLDASSYEWISEWLNEIGFEGALNKISGGTVTYSYSENSNFKVTDKCSIKISDVPLGTAISYVSNLRNNLNWQDSLYVDNEAKEAWQVIDKTTSFDWYGKCGLLCGEFKFVPVSETRGNFFIELVCYSSLLSESAKELAAGYTISFNVGDAMPFTAQGENFSFKIAQNGTVLYQSSAPVFADYNDEARYKELFNAHKFIAKEHSLVKTESVILLERACTVYETEIDGVKWRYYVDDELDLTLKKEQESISGIVTTAYKVTEISFNS